MNILTGKHVPRRTFLRGMGATVALPLLDAMIPAGGHKWEGEEALNKTRLVCIEEVHGTAGCSDWGASQNLFAPAKLGSDFELTSQSLLAPLQPWQDYLTIISNTDSRMAEAFTPEEIGGDHFRCSSVFLTQSHPKQTQGSDIYLGVSVDQLYAQQFGKDTPLPSLQLCIEPLDQSGGCWYNYACAYTDSISWASATDPLPMIRNPRVAFDRVFGAGGTQEERAIRRRSNSSILDWIAGEVTTIRNQVGSEDRQRIDQYLGNIREVERRITAVEAYNNSGEPRELPDAPAGVPDSFTEHMHLMFDVQFLALQTDMTRVTSFKTGRDASNRIFPESGTTKAFHPASHHGNAPEAILEFNKIQQYRLGTMAYFLEKLKNTTEGGVSLLDKTVVLWGSPMSDPNVHNHKRCPLIMVGKGNGALTGNLNLRAPEGTPMANAYLSLLHGLGLTDLQSFGDSTGEFSLGHSAKPLVSEASAG